jgi:ferredoxin
MDAALDGGESGGHRAENGVICPELLRQCQHALQCLTRYGLYFQYSQPGARKVVFGIECDGEPEQWSTAMTACPRLRPITMILQKSPDAFRR